jgi:hypothetical protein
VLIPDDLYFGGPLTVDLWVAALLPVAVVLAPPLVALAGLLWDVWESFR